MDAQVYTDIFNGRRTAHKTALDYLNRVQRRKTVVFLISDFLDAGADAALFSSLALTNQRHDLVCIALSDPRESALPAIGLITLEDAETGEMVEIDTGNRSTRQRYAALAKARRQSFSTQMRQKGLDWIAAATDQPYLPALRQLFARRASRH